MKSLSAIVLLAMLAHSWSSAVWAQTPPGGQNRQREMKKQFTQGSEKASAPTAQHKVLAAFVGDFDQFTEVHLGPREPMKAKGIGTGRWILGGRFVEVRSESAPDEDLKGERLLIYGYDPAAKKYTLYNFESGSLGVTTATGEYNAASKTFTFDGQRDEPGASKIPFRWVLKVLENGELEQKILVNTPQRGIVEVVSVKHVPKAK
jgi:hypothetical protein